MIPDLCRKICAAGHYCSYSTIGAAKMRDLAIRRAESDHNSRYPNKQTRPKFNPESVDLSAIKENMTFFYSWSLKQSQFLNEPNGEIDFTHSKNEVGGIFGYEVTTDANRKIITRIAHYTIEGECATTWTNIFRKMKEIYPHLNNNNNVIKVDGALGA